MTDRISLHECLILGPCCMTHLYASGYMQTILGTMPVPVVVASLVYQQSHLIYSDPDDKIRQTTEEINVHTFIENKLLRLFSPNNEVEDLAANITHCRIVDDEEAITYAIAQYYNWSVGTDDLQATLLLTKRTPEVQILSSLDIVKYWVDTTCPSLPVIKTLLRNMQGRALYKPDITHHLYNWWEVHSNP